MGPRIHLRRGSGGSAAVPGREYGGKEMRMLRVVMFLIALCTPAFAEYKCEECPKEGNCIASESAGDECNQAKFHVWCEGGKWYRGDSYALTLLNCIAIDPPSYPWTSPEEGK